METPNDSGFDQLPVTNGNGDQSSPSVQVIQNFLQHNQIIKESETAQLIRMEEHLRKSNPALADKWVDEALEVSRHKRGINKDMMDVIKREQLNEFLTDLSNSLVSIIALLAILGAVVYAIYMNQPWVAATIFGGATAIVIGLRIGKKAESEKSGKTKSSPKPPPIKPSKPPRRKPK